MHLKIVAEDLRKMRIGMRYKGYACVLIAAKLSLGKQGDPMYITKDLFPSIAEQTRLTQEAVESNITYVVQKCWENNRTYLGIPAADCRIRTRTAAVQSGVH